MVRGLRVETLAGVEIVSYVWLDVHQGEVLALVGESGCGKTTTAHALLGNARQGTRITEGEVVLERRDILSLSDEALRHVRGSRISYVSQDPAASLSPRRQIGNQVVEALEVHGVPSEASTPRVHELFDQVRLPTTADFMNRYPFELSGGQQQRVAIAMALACKPVVIVLDEPTTGLDVTTQARILELLRELGRDTGAAFVYVTHDLAVVDGLADRVAVMYAGRIVETGPREEVFHRPAHPYTSLLLAAVPRLSARRRLSGIAGTTPPPGHRPLGCTFAPRCPLAIDPCRREFPRPKELGARHTVRCWRAGEPMPGSKEGMAVEPEAREMPPLLVAEGIVAAYGKGKQRNTVLHGVSLAIEPGECVALVGESGSGKTTLGRCIAGLHKPDDGVITLAGDPLSAAVTARTADHRRAVQIVFQNPDRSLNPSQTAAQAIGRPLRLFEFADRMTEREQVYELLDRVNLPRRLADRYPRELSGGEKQRVAIARALAARPSLLICDEVTSALDVSIQAEVVRLLQDLQREGLALLFITHNLALVNSVAQRVLVLEQGEIREQGNTRQVIAEPRDAYTRELIAAAPELSVP